MGAAAIFARFALQGAGPLAVAAARLTIASIVLFGLAGLQRNRMNAPAPGRRARTLFAFAGVALAVHFSTWIASLAYTSVAVSTLLVATTPLWTAAYDALIHRRLPNAATAAAFGAGAAGLALVTGFDRAAAPHPGFAWLGAALAVAGAVAFAAYLLIVREAHGGVSTRTVVTHTYGWASLWLVLAAAAVRQAPPPLADVPAWGGIVAMALVSQLLGHTAINASLRWFTPSAVSFANLLEPVFATVLALVLFGEPIAPLAIAGGTIVLASVLIVVRTEPRSQLMN